MNIRSGVLTGEEAIQLYEFARKEEFAIPAVNIIGTNSINAALETAAAVKSPIIIQLSYVAARFMAGAGLSDDGSTNDGHASAIAGAVSTAYHLHHVAHLYGVSVILHTDHADRKLLPWVDGLLEKNRDYYVQTGRSLLSSHMLDLSAEPLDKNLETCSTYLAEMSQLGLALEMELGVTGGVEDGFDHTGADPADLYTKPEEIAQAWKTLSDISPLFTIAASFGNVHGVYRPGNVTLKPGILREGQELIRRQFHTNSKPVSFVFHGGSGCTRAEIREAIAGGTVKMNINTDLQWAFWEGVKKYYHQHEDRLQAQIGNPDGEDQPNKSWYNPMSWLRAGEQRFKECLIKYYEDLNCVGRTR